jgi:Fe-S cluster biosynthesis and repair protein YggX
MTTHTLYCQKLRINAPALPKAPYPGPLGEQIFRTISQPAWQAWLKHQTLLINEYKLNVIDRTAREFLETQMREFLWGEGADKPAGYTPPT